MKFEVVVRNVNTESAKVGYNPATGTNWSHLPMELRAECSKNMDFKTRECLRATSTIEKALIEWKKVKFSRAVLIYGFQSRRSLDELRMSVADSLQFFSVGSRDHSVPLSLAERVLKTADIELFILATKGSREDEMGGILEIASRNAPLVFKKVQVPSTTPSVTRQFLSHCANGAMIEFDEMPSSGPDNFELADFLDIPAVINAKFLKIHPKVSQESLHQLVRKWIECDVPIEQMFRFERELNAAQPISAEDLKREFANRVVPKNHAVVWRTIVRIRSDNESKHILVLIEHFSFTKVAGIVVPASLPESEEFRWTIKASRGWTFN